MPVAAKALDVISRRIGLLVCGVLVLCSCSSTGTAYEYLRNPPGLAARTLELRLTDGRSNVDQKDRRVAFVTVPGLEREYVPPLEPGLQALLEQALHEHMLDGERALRLEVTVLEGVAGWAATFWNESEHASARVSVQAWDETENRLLASGEGESWAEHKSMDTSTSAVKRILSTAIKGALYSCLQSEAFRSATVR